jgi:Fe-S cluster assembly iron-binding protein IscA
MLTVTENARTIVQEITEKSDPDITALRISADASPEAAFAVSAVTGAEPGDQTVQDGGATIHLDEAAAQQLDDKILDAAIDQNGSIQFSLAPQE